MGKTKKDYWVVQFFHPKDRKWYCIDNKAYSIQGVAYIIRNVYRGFGVKAQMKKVVSGKVKLKEFAVWDES